MTLMKQLSTNTVSTLDWLKATENMVISAYDPTAAVQATQVKSGQGGVSLDEATSEPMFGTHIRETAETVKSWFNK